MKVTNNSLLKAAISVCFILLAACSAWFSILGLASLFSGASTAVIIMASVLEISKLITSMYLYRFWNDISKILKLYLFCAVVIIMCITSSGVYGYLTSAYTTTKNHYEMSSLANDSINTHLVHLNSNLEGIRQELTMNSNKSSKLLALPITPKIEKDLSNLDDMKYKLTNSVRILNDSINKLKLVQLQTSLKVKSNSELGPLIFISKLIGVDMDYVVNILILLLIIVFDPLAVGLSIAVNTIKDDELIPVQDPETEVEEVLLVENEEEIVEPELEQELIQDDLKIIDEETLKDEVEEIISTPEEQVDIVPETKPKKERKKRQKKTDELQSITKPKIRKSFKSNFLTTDTEKPTETIETPPSALELSRLRKAAKSANMYSGEVKV